MRRINIKNLKKLLILLSCLLFLFTIYQIKNTYALFYSEKIEQVAKQLGKWNIKINNQDISNASIQELLIDNFVVQENSHTLPGKFAPGMAGSFEICIDPTSTDVSIEYIIKIDTTNLDGNSINIISIEEIEHNNSIVEIEENTYLGRILLEDIKNNITNTIKIVFEWTNNEQYNSQDTSLGTVLNPKLNIPISFKAIQYERE